MYYTNYKQARNAAWQILIDCKIEKLPVSMNEVCKHLGVRLLSYSDADTLIQTHGLSEIAAQTDGLSFFIKDTPVILFNSQLPLQRNRFTIAHELGHIILQHISRGQVTRRNREPSQNDDEKEMAANQFAARLLAPACVLWGLNIHTPTEIADLCGISRQAATFRAERMEELYRRNKFLSSPLERQVYEQFRVFIARQ